MRRMRSDVRGWVALVIVGVCSVATSPPQRAAPPTPTERILNAGILDTVTLTDGMPTTRRYKVRLAAAANVDGGEPRVGELWLNPSDCVYELDGGSTCFTGRLGPAVFNFSDGGHSLPLFDSCGVDVDCEQSVEVEVRGEEASQRTVRTNISLTANVRNAGFVGQDALLSITPE